MSSTSTSSRAPFWVVPTTVGIVAVALIAFIVWGGASTSGSEAAPVASRDASTTQADAPSTDGPAQDNPPTTVDEPSESGFEAAERREEGDLLAIGPIDAPVVLVVFADYQCSFCAKWSAETLPVMMDYATVGDLRIEWRDVNVYGQDSERASRASYAAALQGKFWEYHDELYRDGKISTSGGLSEESLVTIAEQLSLDVPTFRADMAAEATAAEVSRNQELGINLGAFSTPSFVMGGQPMVGALPTEDFVDAFEQALANAGR